LLTKTVGGRLVAIPNAAPVLRVVFPVPLASVPGPILELVSIDVPVEVQVAINVDVNVA